MVSKRSTVAFRDVVAPEEVAAPAPDIGNLPTCIEEVRVASLDGDRGPEDPTELAALRGRLEACRTKFPPLYRQEFYTPYVATLDRLGPDGFTSILVRDPQRERTAGLMLDMAQAILQNGESYADRATDAFQEVVSDLYDGFLSAEDRSGVKKPDRGVIPPLVKWGSPLFGPYTWPVDATSTFGAKAGVVNLPPSNARRCLLAWAALGHETAGHDVLHADDGLPEELADAVRDELRKAKVGDGIPEYWGERIDETASDVCGILNMGPAAAIGLIGYFRGLNAAFTGKARLRNDGPEADPHPADILRGWLAAATVRLLSFRRASAWGEVIEKQTNEDVTTVRLAGVEITPDAARRSAEIVAQTIVRRPMRALENHALGRVQDWRDRDERVVQKLRLSLATAKPLLAPYASGVYAAHVVAAAVMSALAAGGDVPLVFERMVTLLKAMHDGNPSWGPLYVAYPGDLAAHYAYQEVEEG